jgi:tetratricopeptide (TPR) repeat protein
MDCPTRPNTPNRPNFRSIRNTPSQPAGASSEAPRIAALVVFTAFTFLGGARAAAADAQSVFAEGTAAFQSGDYPRALQLYEQSLALGMQGPAVQFNVGVAAYRSGNYARAEQAFHEVAQTPAMAQIAYYNLGLVALKRADDDAARGWFERAARESTDERVTALARQRLGELPQPRVGSPWSYYLRAGLGYDDNVALRSESVETPGTGQDDAFAEVFASGSYSFLPLWRVDGAAGLMRYSDLDEFDQGVLSFGVAREIPLDAWNLEVGGYATQLTLGGDVYERSAAAAAQASHDLGASGTLRGQLRLSSVDGVGDFTGLSGTRGEFAVQYAWSWRGLDFIAHTRAEDDRTDDDLFALRWWQVGAKANWAATPLWSFSADVRFRAIRHPAVPDLRDAREDRRQSYRLEATRLLAKRVQLWIRAEHERNVSPDELFDYSRNWIAASVEFWR